PTQGKTRKLGFHLSSCTTREHTGFLYSFSRLLWHIFPITVYFIKTAHTQPLTEDEITKTLYDVCRMTPPSQNVSHTHQKTYNLCSIENVCLLIYLTMDNKTQTTAININLCNHHFNCCAAPSQYYKFYHCQHTTIWVLH